MTIIEIFFALAYKIQEREISSEEAFQVITGAGILENLTSADLSFLHHQATELFQSSDPISVEFARLVYLVNAAVADEWTQAVFGNTFGNILNKFGDLQEAESVITESIRIFSRLDRQSAAVLTGNLGWTKFRTGRSSEAIEHFNVALASAINHNDYRNELEWRLGLGFSHNSAGSYPLALEHCQKGISLARQISMDSYEGKLITCQALIYENLGYLERAIESHQRALQFSLQTNNISEEIQDHMNLANLYLKLNSVAESQNEYSKALQLAERIKDVRSHTAILANYGSSLLKTGAVEESQKVFSQVLEQARRHALAEIEDQALGNLAAAYLLDDKPSLAVPYLKESLNHSRIRGHPRSEIQDCLNLSLVYLKMNDRQKALKYADYAFDKAIFINEPSLIWSASWKMSRLLRLSNDSRQQGWEKLLLAIETIENYRINIRSDENRIGFYTDKSTPYFDAVDYLLEDGLTKEALAFAERGKSRLLIDLLSENQLNEISRPLDGDAVLSILKKTHSSTGFISIFSFPEKTVLFRVAPQLNSIDSVILPLSEHDIKEWLLRWQELLEDENPEGIESAWKEESLSDVRRELRWLDEQLAKPIRKWCDDMEINEIVISPHRLFHRLPIHAALSSETNRYFIEDKQVSYIPTVQLFNFLGQYSGYNNRAIAFGYPGKEDQFLEHVETEVKCVAEILKIKPILEESTSERFIREAQQSQVIHLACHAYHNNVDFLKSFFTFYESILTVKQIAQLNLRGINLLVTAACDSGKITPGGIGEALGFSRSWLIAGVKTIICSQWVVWDYCSLELMKLFYLNYASTGNKLKSLVNAQRELITGQTALSDPRAWSTFMLIGLS